ncbi:MAG: hypothetical protein ACLGHL_03660, partial [Actinomycetota bacterium]
MLATSARISPARRHAWRLMSLGLLIYGFGNVLWFSHNLLMDMGESIIGSANLLYFAGYALCAMGVALGIKRRDP